MDKVLFGHIKNIQEAINNNNLVLFVGAGVSANSGVPTWGQLIEQLARDLGIKQFTSQDYLKIPQYYSNKHPKKYLPRIKSILDKDWLPNPISKFLYEFNPRHIITTNYDCILEKTATNLKKNFYTICQDKDIPKASNNQTIIKMHGDFNNENIVLKEDEYLHYSNNFKLMETFIKSVFATNTVIFVGFSADDPNVNQIYHWVKDILEKDKKPAYLIQIDKITDISKTKKEKLIIQDYFERKGIYQINYSYLEKIINNFISDNELNEKLEKKTKELTHPIGKNLYKTLYFIKNYYGDILDYFYNKMCKLEPFNFVSHEDLYVFLSSSLEKYPIYMDYKGRFINSTSTRLNHLINIMENPTNLQNDDKEKLEYIKKILQKNGVTKLNYTKKEHEKEFILKGNDENIPFNLLHESLVLLNEFDYISANKRIQKFNQYENINSVNIFEKAYILFKLNKYSESYTELKEISSKSYQNQNYLIYVLSEFNRKQVGYCLKNQLYWKKCSDIEIYKNGIRSFEEELNQIKIEELIQKYLPDDSKKFIGNKLNNNFFREYLDKFFKLSKDINTEQIYLTGTPSYHHLLYEIFTSNFIFIENDHTVRNLYYWSVQLMIQDVKNKIKQQNDNAYFKHHSLLNQQEREINGIDLYIMIEYMKPKELDELFCRYNLKSINLTEKEADGRKTKDILLSSYLNLINSIIKLNLVPQLSHGRNRFFDYIYNFFIIFSKIKLTKDEFNQVISKYVSLLKTYDEYKYDNGDIFKYLIDFIIEEYNDIEKRRNIDVDILSNILINIINKTKKYDTDQSINWLRIDRLTRNLSSIINSLEKDYILVDSNDLLNDWNIELFKEVYIYLYKIMPKNEQLRIKKIIDTYLKDDFDEELYHNACIEGIIEPNKKCEKLLFNKIKEYGDEKVKIKPKNNDIHNLLDMVANLINFGKVLDKTPFFEFQNEESYDANNYFNFVLNMENFDYNNFEINFIRYLCRNRMNELKLIIKNNNNIENQIKEKYRSTMSFEGDKFNDIKNNFFYLLFDSR